MYVCIYIYIYIYIVPFTEWILKVPFPTHRGLDNKV